MMQLEFTGGNDMRANSANRKTGWRLTLLATAMLMATNVAAADSEEDFLPMLPMVTTLTRLPQAQMDLPAAVTVLNRDMIRRSGARDAVDLMRWVPGMFVSGWNGAHRIAAYHASLDEYATRMQVFIDGRSAFSTLYIGGAATPLAMIPLDDIERVEVIRGSNSAAVGGNALFGVINIVTRHADDTLGLRATVSSGGNSIADGYASAGFKAGPASVRISAATLADEGFSNKIDSRRADQVNIRSDIDLKQAGRLSIFAGAQELRSYDGFPNTPSDPLRRTVERGSQLAAAWTREVNSGNEIKLTADYTTETAINQYDVDLGRGLIVNVNAGGESRRTNLELQQTIVMAPQWRWVWGVGFRRESARAEPVFEMPEVSFNRLQVFGNAEWRPTADWIVNLGGLYEDRSGVGDELAPRLGVNYHISPTQTVRVASGNSFRMPSLFESFGSVWARDKKTGTKLFRDYYAVAVPDSERLTSSEVGYLHHWTAPNALLDIRVFQERVTRMLKQVPNTAKPPNQSRATIISGGELDINGLEYQLRWQPLEGMELRIGQTYMDAAATPGEFFANNVPDRVDSLGIQHRFGNGIEISAVYSAIGAVSSRGWGTRVLVPAVDQLDVRIGRAFTIGQTRAEAALTWVAVSGAVPIYNIKEQFTIPRQLFATLRFAL